jgi:hypothetical protein
VSTCAKALLRLYVYYVWMALCVCLYEVLVNTWYANNSVHPNWHASDV